MIRPRSVITAGSGLIVGGFIAQLGVQAYNELLAGVVAYITLSVMLVGGLWVLLGAYLHSERPRREDVN